jgi:hypothetical protein
MTTYDLTEQQRELTARIDNLTDRGRTVALYWLALGQNSAAVARAVERVEVAGAREADPAPVH